MKKKAKLFGFIFYSSDRQGELSRLFQLLIAKRKFQTGR